MGAGVTGAGVTGGLLNDGRELGLAVGELVENGAGSGDGIDTGIDTG